MLLNLDYFADLHHGLVNLHGMHPDASIDMLYALNTAIIDTQHAHGERRLPESTKTRFRSYLQRIPTRPPHNLMTLYDALECIESEIDMSAMMPNDPIRLDRYREQTDAMVSLAVTIRDVHEQFARLYGYAIEVVREAYDIIGIYEITMEYNPLPGQV